MIGSSYSALTPKNPFTADQVKELIKTYFSEEDFSRIVFVEQIDLYDKALWVKNVTQKIKKISKNSSCALVTYVKDITGDYQKAFKAFAIEPHEIAASANALHLASRAMAIIRNPCADGCAKKTIKTTRCIDTYQ